jgi:hypothetical protein
MISVGYVLTDGESTIVEQFAVPADANAKVAELKESMADRDDVVTFFLEADFGSFTKRYGYIEP